MRIRSSGYADRVRPERRGRHGVAVSTTYAPLRLTNSNTFRYFLTGDFAAGEVTVAFARGLGPVGPADTPRAIDSADAIGNLASRPSASPWWCSARRWPSRSRARAPTPTCSTTAATSTSPSRSNGNDAIDVASITDLDPEFTVVAPDGVSFALDNSQAPVRIGDSGHTFRYWYTGTFTAGSLQLTTSSPARSTTSTRPTRPRRTRPRRCARSPWPPPATAPGSTCASPPRAASRSTRRSFADAAREITLSGAGLGGATAPRCSPARRRCLRPAAPTSIDNDGDGIVDEADETVFRYYVSRGFVEGSVAVAFTGANWADLDGNPGQNADAELPGHHHAQAADNGQGGQSVGKVFFIEISGGVKLQGLGFTDEPIIDIRGGVTLEIGDYVLPERQHRSSASPSTPHGTIKIIKLGNIGSAAARFVLQTGDTVSGDPEFWGVAKIQANFDFLKNYGIFADGSALLQINTTPTPKTEKIVLEGIPGDVIVKNLPTSFNISSLSTAVLGEVDLPTAWDSELRSTSIRHTAALDRHRPDRRQRHRAHHHPGPAVEDRHQDRRRQVRRPRTSSSTTPPTASSTCSPRRRPSSCPPSRSRSRSSARSRSRKAAPPTRTPTTRCACSAASSCASRPGASRSSSRPRPQIPVLGLNGKAVGLLIIDGDTSSPGLPGIALMLNVELTLGASPDGAGGSDQASALDGIFELRGSVVVTLNTTLREQVFEIPQSFLDLLPDDAPTTVTVYASAPEIDGSKREDAAPEFYVSANIQGSIILFDTLTLTGFISFTAATDIDGNAFVRIAGAVQVNIEVLGALSGSLDLQFFTNLDGQGPGIIGRVQLVRTTDGLLLGVIGIERAVPARGEFVLLGEDDHQLPDQQGAEPVLRGQYAEHPGDRPGHRLLRLRRRHHRPGLPPGAAGQVRDRRRGRDQRPLRVRPQPESVLHRDQGAGQDEAARHRRVRHRRRVPARRRRLRGLHQRQPERGLRRRHRPVVQRRRDASSSTSAACRRRSSPRPTARRSPSRPA